MPIKTVWDLNLAAVVTAEIIGFELHEKKFQIGVKCPRIHH